MAFEKLASMFEAASNGYKKKRALRALVEYHARDPRLRDILLNALGDRELFDGSVARALEYHLSPDIVPDLLFLLNTGWADYSVVKLLGLIGDRRATKPLLSLRLRLAPNLREAAAVALWRIADPDSKDELEKWRACERSQEVRRFLESALGKLKGGKQEQGAVVKNANRVIRLARVSLIVPLSKRVSIQYSDELDLGLACKICRKTRCAIRLGKGEQSGFCLEGSHSFEAWVRDKYIGGVERGPSVTYHVAYRFGPFKHPEYEDYAKELPTETTIRFLLECHKCGGKLPASMGARLADTLEHKWNMCDLITPTNPRCSCGKVLVAECGRLPIVESEGEMIT